MKNGSLKHLLYKYYLNILKRIEAFYQPSYQPATLYIPTNLYIEKERIFSQKSKASVSSDATPSAYDAPNELDLAEYNFGHINFGDTLANWAITIPYRAHQPNAIPARQLSNRLIKRALDITVSVLVIVFFLSWMIPVIGLLIKFESKGPIFFKQLRSGLNNQPFWCFKFRSMYINDECDELQATRGDYRITRIGAFLRKTSLDEFPQFFNVLKGEMSIVGPRPHMLRHTDEYGVLIDNYMSRLTIKQGLTGWAQIKGCRGETSDIKLMEKRVINDLWYLENWSFWLDMKIIYFTIIQIFKQRDHVF